MPVYNSNITISYTWVGSVHCTICCGIELSRTNLNVNLVGCPITNPSLAQNPPLCRYLAYSSLNQFLHHSLQTKNYLFLHKKSSTKIVVCASEHIFTTKFIIVVLIITITISTTIHIIVVIKTYFDTICVTFGLSTWAMITTKAPFQLWKYQIFPSYWMVSMCAQLLCMQMQFYTTQPAKIFFWIKKNMNHSPTQPPKKSLNILIYTNLFMLYKHLHITLWAQFSFVEWV